MSMYVAGFVLRCEEDGFRSNSPFIWQRPAFASQGILRTYLHVILWRHWLVEAFGCTILENPTP